MREILFRGKRIKNGKWVKGNLVQMKFKPDEDLRTMIFVDCESCEESKYYEVDDKTVGQYIGLKDRNGNQIFEGDLLRFYSDLRGGLVGEPCTVRYGAFNCTCCEGVYGWEFDNGDIRDVGYYEVISNIHDNSELIAN